jgi:hypothetical protein
MWSLTALAADATRCTKVGLEELVPEAAGPTIVVLGERPGVEADADRVVSVVKALAKRGPVTMALQAFPRDLADEFGRLERGEITAVSISKTPADPTGSDSTVRVVTLVRPVGDKPPVAAHLIPVGVPLGERKPPDVPLAVPPLYIHPLAEAMGEGKMPPELEPRFVEQVAWIDHRLASGAIEGWDGAGFLVIVVDRLHVQGGLGVAWQATQMSDVPVHQALLANAGTQCVDADRVLRSSIF